MKILLGFLVAVYALIYMSDGVGAYARVVFIYAVGVFAGALACLNVG